MNKNNDGSFGTPMLIKVKSIFHLSKLNLITSKLIEKPKARTTCLSLQNQYFKKYMSFS